MQETWELLVQSWEREIGNDCSRVDADIFC